MKRYEPAIFQIVFFFGLAHAGTTMASAQSPTALPRIGIVNIWVTDLARSGHFYQAVFDLAAPRAYNSREHVFTLDPSGPRLELVLTDTPRANGNFSVLVADLDRVVSRTPAAGGKIVRSSGEPMANYRSAVIMDPDGTEIEVLQSAAVAAQK